MPPPRNAEARPRQGTGDQEGVHIGKPSVSDPTDIAGLLDGFAVVVSTPQGKHVRRLYLSLHSAESAARRAWDAGKPARLLLVRITPVTWLLDEQEGATWAA